MNWIEQTVIAIALMFAVGGTNMLIRRWRERSERNRSMREMDKERWDPPQTWEQFRRTNKKRHDG